MKWTKISAIFGTVLIVVAIAVKLSGTVDISEPNEPHNSMTICDKCPHIGWFNEPEPNEPECTHENIKDSYTSCAVGHGDGSTCWVCPDCGEYVNSKESNENEWIRLPEPEPPMKYSLPIPTWPDFIELEKELRVSWPVNSSDNEFRYVLEKGTKIYFKE